MAVQGPTLTCTGSSYATVLYEPIARKKGGAGAGAPGRGTHQPRGVWATQWTVTDGDGREKTYNITLFNGNKIKKVEERSVRVHEKGGFFGSKATTFIQIDDTGVEKERVTPVMDQGKPLYQIDADTFRNLGVNLHVGGETVAKIDEIWQRVVQDALARHIDAEEAPALERRDSFTSIAEALGDVEETFVAAEKAVRRLGDEVVEEVKERVADALAVPGSEEEEEDEMGSSSASGVRTRLASSARDSLTFSEAGDFPPPPSAHLLAPPPGSLRERKTAPVTKDLTLGGAPEHAPRVPLHRRVTSYCTKTAIAAGVFVISSIVLGHFAAKWNAQV